MSLLLVAFISVCGIILGKKLFKKWFNHLALYCFIMGGLIFFYELKLLSYPQLKPYVWFLIVSTFLSYLLGIITIFSIRNLNSESSAYTKIDTLNSNLFKNDGRLLKYSVLVFSFIGLFVALHRWYILIGYFGSIQNVIINAAIVYKLNAKGEIKEFIPILPSFIYVGVFLSGIYTAYKGRFSFLSFFPLITVILKELTYFGRGEMLFSSMEFIFTFFLFRNFLTKDSNKRFKFSKNNAFVAIIVLLGILITASSFIRVSRGVKESYVGTSRQLSQFKDNFLFTPSVYLYISSDIGVFNKYLELENEEAKFGENTFHFFYEFLSRFNITPKPNFFQKGYFIPMWVNTGTYLREIHADFGIVGLLLIPYLLGLTITLLWFKFYSSANLNVLLILVFLFIIIGFSFLTMVTRLNQWFFAQFLTIIYLFMFEKISGKKNVVLAGDKI